jgi:DNA invertase Pin-like site-specific DNA recombinase
MDQIDNVDIVCVCCGKDDGQLLLCDGCNRGFHTFCLNMRSIPTGSWYCPSCMRKSASVPVPATTTTTTTKKVEKPKKVEVYIRVSSVGQNNPEFGRVGMDTQNTAILEFCIKNGLYVKTCTTEVGSAYRTNTPELNSLINKLKPNVPIMVYSASRFSRNMNCCELMIEEIHKKESYVWSVTDEMTSKDPAFMSLIRAAQNESRVQGQRVRDSVIRIKQRGGFVGSKKPFGYDIVRDESGMRVLKENIIEQRIMKRICDYQKKIGSFSWEMRQGQSAAASKHLAAIAFFDNLTTYVVKTFPRYMWTDKILNDILYVDFGKKFKIIAAPAMVEEDLMEAIEEVEDSVPITVLKNVWIVDSIEKIREHNNVYEFFVKWDVPGRNKYSWENARTMNEDVPDIVKEFLENSTSKFVSRVKVFIGMIW